MHSKSSPFYSALLENNEMMEFLCIYESIKRFMP